MRKKLLSICLSALFVVPFIVVAEEEPCKIIPKAGKVYEAGFCIDTVNMCLELPDGILYGDCFREVVIE
ncbi:hypothetical protein SAMN06295967_102128 [Belliella buryatensis]|uniref:NVEALA protein n=1 Tax=Belliella buryatensis TaxID=1500549 RepID=A0A239B4Q0_9BACT|nr:hypothetical protein [Belliella buryatensis]SNS02926.1 hypothetical protein SAMN06295967_102128 [Belliella buryatensis]